MRKTFFFRILILGFFILVSSQNVLFAQTQEQILSFQSEISVQQNSNLIITETIKVYATGQKIKRGIYRDFPTRYKDRLGNNYVVGFKVISVLRDGQPDQYHIRNIANGQRVYIGNSNYRLARGEYTYTLIYRTTQQLGFFKDHDELYWNVTGNGWAFPILNAKAIVDLPQNANESILQYKSFIGYQGSQKGDTKVQRDIFGRLVFETTKTLLPNQGLTIAVMWPKGYVSEPTQIMKLKHFLAYNRNTIYMLLGFIFILFYYLLAWHLFGRDPARGTIIPLFYPPKNISPATMRYILKMKYDHKVFAVAILNMAVKKFLKIEENDYLGILNFGKTYTLTKTSNPSSLAPEEKVITPKLFGLSETIELKKENCVQIESAVSKLKSHLKKNVESKYFFLNQGYLTFGIFLSIGFFFVTSNFLESNSIPALWIFSLWASTLILNAVFYHLLKAPTSIGRKLMDQIEGFKMFLSVTEKERLKILNPPEKTPELFEKYLPYALALDVEHKWSEQFSDVFARLEQQGQTYYPGWYSGGLWRSSNLSGFTSSLGSSFSSAIASSSTPPGSSSGFGGGGGFSGGGGGGGGGGGW